MSYGPPQKKTPTTTKTVKEKKGLYQPLGIERDCIQEESEKQEIECCGGDCWSIILPSHRGSYGMLNYPQILQWHILFDRQCKNGELQLSRDWRVILQHLEKNDSNRVTYYLVGFSFSLSFSFNAVYMHVLLWSCNFIWEKTDGHKLEMVQYSFSMSRTVAQQRGKLKLAYSILLFVATATQMLQYDNFIWRKIKGSNKAVCCGKVETGT